MFEEQIKKEKSEPGLVRYLDEFLEDRVDDLEKMKNCLSDKRFNDICGHAHHLKGFCTPYGFDYLGYLAKELEVTAKLEDVMKTKELLNLMELYLTEKTKYLQ